MLTAIFLFVAAILLDRSLALTILTRWPARTDADRFYAAYRWIAFPRTLLVAAPAGVSLAGGLLHLDRNLVTGGAVACMAGLVVVAVVDGVRAARAAVLG